MGHVNGVGDFQGFIIQLIGDGGGDELLLQQAVGLKLQGGLILHPLLHAVAGGFLGQQALFDHQLHHLRHDLRQRQVAVGAGQLLVCVDDTGEADRIAVHHCNHGVRLELAQVRKVAALGRRCRNRPELQHRRTQNSDGPKPEAGDPACV